MPDKNRLELFSTPRGHFTDFADAARDEHRYHRQLQRLAARARGRRIERLVQDGVRFSQILDDADRVVSLIARAVTDGSYRPGSAVVAEARLGGRPREIGRVGAVDFVVHAVIAEILAERIEPHLSHQLYSYRRGRSPWQVARLLAKLARDHRRSIREPRARGLYVLRGDVQSYTDSIPLDDDSPLWPDLQSALGISPTHPHAAMIRALLRPTVAGSPRARGLLFGLPTTNVIANLYLTSLDRELEALGAAYARYGDDIVFADAHAERVREALTILRRTLEARGLTANPRKLRVLFWNGAPRKSLQWPEAIPSAKVTLLGADINFDGTIALSTEKWRGTLRDARARIVATRRLAADAPLLARAKLLAEVVNEAFDPRSDLAAEHADLLATLVDDRRQLRQLDYLLTVSVAEAATRQRGTRAFRQLAYRTLRRECGLVSRVVARNRSSGRPQ